MCGCGAAGSAESLGWHHGMCGPCADRVAEFGPDAVAHAPGLLADAEFQPRDVTFTPDGKFAVGMGGRSCRVWDAPTGAPRPVGDSSELDGGGDLSASPDGRFVLLGTYEGGALLLQLADGEVDFLVLPSPVRIAHWTGRPTELLIQTTDGRLQLANADDGRMRPSAAPPTSRARLHAVRPDPTAPRAVFADGHRASVATIEPDGTFDCACRFLLGDGRLNRTGMWERGPEIVRFAPDGERLLFVRGTEMELRLPSRPKALQQVEFTRPVLDVCFAPDYERVYVLTDDGVIHVCGPGMLTSVRARLRWHVEPATRLALAPDGRTLATVGPEGVKFWPVANLLPLLE